MHRRPQFGMRENPASDGRHGSRTVVRPVSNATPVEKEAAASPPPELPQNHPPANVDNKPNAAPPRAATIGMRCEGNLLTVHEVAEMLGVSVSWVYGRTRARSVERLPGIRLGKYWRFREEDIHAWVEVRSGVRRAS
mgnify:CR=1 FL=1